MRNGFDITAGAVGVLATVTFLRKPTLPEILLRGLTVLVILSIVTGG